MDELEAIERRIRRALPNVPAGTLRIWGQWFGRPYDNLHFLQRTEIADGALRLYFDGGEALSVWSPQGLTLNSKTVRIDTADRVRWEWFFYGRSKTPENLRVEDYVRTDEVISAKINVSTGRRLDADVSHPAVELVIVDL
jgi:hypothetical protein